MGMIGDGLSYWQAETANITLLDTTIGDLLDKRAEAFSAREALVYSCYPEFGDALNFRWSYREFRERSEQVARGLMALGLQKGAHVAVWAANLPEWLLLYMATAKAGLVLVTINPATDAVVPVGERGELCYRGFAVMREYYHIGKDRRNA